MYERGRQRGLTAFGGDSAFAITRPIRAVDTSAFANPGEGNKDKAAETTQGQSTTIFSREQDRSRQRRPATQS